MTKSEVIKEFFKKSVLPVAVAALLYCIFGSLGTALPLFLLNFIIGGVIGGFVLVWRLLVAVWYIFLTIYRINAECIL